MRKTKTNETRSLTRLNGRYAKEVWGAIVSQRQLRQLRDLTERYGFSVAGAEIQLLNGNWYVTHAGLLRLAERKHCKGIRVQQVREFCDPAAGRWVFKAIIYKNSSSKGFAGYGDADPSNTSLLVRGAEMRVAETRAVNRALRKAFGIGICSVEELGWLAGSPGSTKEQTLPAKTPNQNGSNNGQPRLRDRLYVLIRQHNLDPAQVKAYAADFCGTPTLREANRELVESFVSHLETSAQENRDALICKLNSYAQPAEVKS
jgi:hypothetical protein